MTHAIADHLYDIRRQSGDRFFKLFDDWLALSTIALSRPLNATAEQIAEHDKPYLEIMRRYGPRVAGKDHPADHFSYALGAFLSACQKHSQRDKSIPDILGAIYEQESLANSYSGQFFTPEPMAQMMTAMMIEPTDEAISIADPACGSGRFFIAAQPLAPNASFTGTDVDLTCVRMSALNMLVRNANATIVHGNSLTLEVWGGYRTIKSPFGGKLQELKADEARAVLVAVATAAKQQAPGNKTGGNVQASTSTEPVRPSPAGASTQPIITGKKGQFDFGF